MKPHLRASLLALLFTCALSAQTVTTTVTRVVTDPSGAPPMLFSFLRIREQASNYPPRQTAVATIPSFRYCRVNTA